MAFDFIKFLRRKGLKQQEAAELFGVTQATISNWCKGKTPDFLTVEKLIGHGLTAQELFGDEIGLRLMKNSGFVEPRIELSDEDLSRAFLRAAQILGEKKK